MNLILKTLVIWIGIASAETLHGILRVKFLNPRVGDLMGRRIAVLTGSAIILTFGWFAIPWIGPSTSTECIVVGVIWLALMLTFDIALARCVFRFSYERIAVDFDIRKGNLLGLGMVILFMTPLLVATLRGLL